jgi:hypothetical protein
MSFSKHTNILCGIILICTLVLTLVFINGEALGITVISADAAEDEEGLFTGRDKDPSYDEDTAIRIDLDDLEGEVSGGSYELDGDLYIVQGGTYVLSGSLEEHSVIVNASEAKVQIVLEGVSVTHSSLPGIWVQDADKVFITLAEGTENSVSSGNLDGEAAVEADVDAAIWSKSDLTINGSGSLSVTAEGGHGIKSKDDLVITGGRIEVESDADGLHANEVLSIMEAEVTVAAKDDGIHADDEVNICSGTIRVTESYEGIEGYFINIRGGDIYVTASDDGINAGGGSTSEFGMMGGMSGMNAGGGRSGQFGNKEDFSGEQSESMEDFTGELPEMPEGMEDFSGEMPEMPEGMEDFSGEMPEMPEGMEDFSGERPEMPEGTEDFSGEMPEGGMGGRGGMRGQKELSGEEGQTWPESGTASGFASGAASGSASDAEEQTEIPCLHIYGGNLYVNSEGDGLDSNGDLIIDGGTIVVDGPSSSGNGPLDSGTESGGELIVNGGTILAIGSSGMLESFAGTSEQYSFAVVTEEGYQAGDVIEILDSDGNVLFTHTAARSGSAVIFSSADLEENATYTVRAGDAETTVTLTGISTSSGGARTTFNRGI